MTTNRKGIKLFKIYALVHENNVFIGKTTGEIKSVFYQHRRAQNAYTAAYYHPRNSKNPEIHILEALSCNFLESYRHIVAWVHIFQEEGYHMINPRGTIDDANDLHTETLSIVNTIRPISLNKVLAETKYCKQVKTTMTDLPPQREEKIAPKKTKHKKITVWTTPEEKERFVAFAKSLELTQSQAIQYLISKTALENVDPLFPDWDNDIFTRTLKKFYEQKLAQLEDENFQLKTTQNLYREDKKAKSTKLDQCHNIVQRAVTDFFEYFDSATPIPIGIERAKYEDYMGNLPKDMRNEYPIHSGSTLIRLQALLLGKGTAPARFVLGITQHGHPIKLRVYPSKYFIGIMPGNERFSQRNSVWYVAWRMTGDVAELIAAYPLQIRPKYKNPMDSHEIFDDIINKFIAESDALSKMDDIF